MLGKLPQVSITQACSQVKCLLFVFFLEVKSFKESDHVSSCLLGDDFMAMVAHVVADDSLIMEHRQVGVLRELGCELTFSCKRKVLLGGDVDQVDCWQSLFKNGSPSAKHDFFRWLVKLCCLK